jgi:pimeloyl-ACP methyl ester carboxylesterase
MLRLSLASCAVAAAPLAGALLAATIGARAPKPEARSVKLDGMRVHYQNYGKGKEAIVFIHGWLSNLTFWRANIPAFAAEKRVIALDLPGHGASDKPAVKYSMDLYARAVDAALKDAGVERAVLVGHSMGTPVARQFYRLLPQKTQALVIVDGNLRALATREAMEPISARFRGPGYEQMIDEFAAFSVRPTNDEKLREELKSSMLAVPPEVAISMMDALIDPAAWQPDKINVPTLALMAKNEVWWPPDYERFAREIVPGIDYRVWDGVSHFLMLDRPREFNEAVAGFLRRHKLMK